MNNRLCHWCSLECEGAERVAWCGCSKTGRGQDTRPSINALLAAYGAIPVAKRRANSIHPPKGWKNGGWR